jgi:hypothetical protein
MPWLAWPLEKEILLDQLALANMANRLLQENHEKEKKTLIDYIACLVTHGGGNVRISPDVIGLVVSTDPDVIIDKKDDGLELSLVPREPEFYDE